MSVSLRTASRLTRAAMAALLALVLALRLLTPAGFMPTFEHGAVTIVACPDFAPAPAAPMHHGGDHKKAQSPCPYAGATTFGGLGDCVAILSTMLLVGAVLLLGRQFSFLDRHRTHDRPPLRGPPFPA